MMMSKLFSQLPPIPEGVVDVTHDSRAVRPGWLFACVVGEHRDGHDFAAQAVADGATALLVERELPVAVPQMVVPNVRAAMGTVAAEVHGGPASRLTMVGITGTNGKTTTAHLMTVILAGAGRRTATIGTLSGVRTTPEAPDLQRQLASYVADGVEAVVMEVSSHALALHRVNGARFDVSVFTNLGTDHLDLHHSMEEYFRAKATLFEPNLSAKGVANLDDPHGQLLVDVANVPMEGFSVADAQHLAVAAHRLTFVWRGMPIDLPIGGRFNVGNVLAALTASESLGIDRADAAASLIDCPPVPGRFEFVSDQDGPVSVIVDYAHTPDGLVELLGAVRAVTHGGRVIVVFGCGGDRDAHKRPMMGAAAAEFADVVIVTNDNPRHERPEDIIAAVVAGAVASGGAPVVEPDRRAAIARALEIADTGDAVVIAGKGHESTQTIGDMALPFDDRLVARELLGGAA
ncbi:MAG TPA: UDP-N-acetylmuramoyl-L-alanyl-D-glutamate--2,6-diaminopimelate ligase [Ilumatobacter sp.]|nr:UDP-N-acetylmuramoyl-L-alanyl-D-glutamate--2,6-diaminopimelate ligase [Ilumatobacter sp.]